MMPHGWLIATEFLGVLMMNTVREEIQTDEHGSLRVGDSRVMLDSVVVAWQQGHSAETIQQQFPALSLADVYGAIAYYLRNRTDVDQYLHLQAALWQSGREVWNRRSGVLVQRLREAASAATAEAP
jgi:uncharacterized protein (DUF433 family)